MAKEVDPAERRTTSVLHARIPDLIGGVARDARLVSLGRVELGKLLADEDLRKLADEDAELAGHVAQVSAAIAEDEEAVAAWQKDLTEASKQWEASLADLAKLHSDDI
jgi:hypothetical protein